MRVLVQDPLVAPIAVPVVMETVRVMERVHFVPEHALNLAHLKMSAQPKSKEQDPLHLEDETGKTTEIRKKIEIMKGKEAKAVLEPHKGDVNHHRSPAPDHHANDVVQDQEVIRQDEVGGDQWIVDV